jgi:hypothetical protein
MDHGWISIVTAIGGFSVSFESILLGYRLFLAGAKGEFKIEVLMNDGTKVSLWSVAPGLALGFFGACLACWSVYRPLPH